MENASIEYFLRKEIGWISKPAYQLLRMSITVVFFRAFLPLCVYKRLDVNMPRVLPLRSKVADLNYDVADYNFDVPITAIGEGSAEQLGYHTSFTQWKFTAAYSSPSLRCLQTVNRYLTGKVFGSPIHADSPRSAIFRTQAREDEYRSLATVEDRTRPLRLLRFQRVPVFGHSVVFGSRLDGKTRHLYELRLQVSWVWSGFGVQTDSFRLGLLRTKRSWKWAR